MNQSFGAKHEDEALQQYQALVQGQVHSQQHRVRLPCPRAQTLKDALQAFPATDNAQSACEDAYFHLTGYVDALVELPQKSGSDHGNALQASASLTAVVEVKHRMSRIKEEPEIYDIVQLAAYCRSLGYKVGHLVQVMRSPECEEGLLLTV